MNKLLNDTNNFINNLNYKLNQNSTNTQSFEATINVFTKEKPNTNNCLAFVTSTDEQCSRKFSNNNGFCGLHNDRKKKHSHGISTRFIKCGERKTNKNCFTIKKKNNNLTQIIDGNTSIFINNNSEVFSNNKKYLGRSDDLY
mgnify:CR=1 FL=1|jgi:hypothetical protein